MFIFDCLPINSWYTLYHCQQTWHCSKAFSRYINQGALLSNGKNQYHGPHHHWIPCSPSPLDIMVPITIGYHGPHHHWIPWSPSPLDTMVPITIGYHGPHHHWIPWSPSPLDTMVPITIGYHGPHHHWIPWSPSPLDTVVPITIGYRDPHHHWPITIGYHGPHHHWSIFSIMWKIASIKILLQLSHHKWPCSGWAAAPHVLL